MEKESQAFLHVSVVIVGAGPTGLTLAHLLGSYGITTLLLERNLEPAAFPRAITIDDEGLRILQALDLGQEVDEIVRTGLGAEYLSRGRLLARALPGSLRNGYPLLSTFSQPALEALLIRKLARYSCVEARFGHTLESLRQVGTQVQIAERASDGTLHTWSCTYLLACDGGKSTVRRIVEIAMRGTTFAQRWLVVDGICEEQAPTEHIRFFCNPTRPAVSVPALAQNWRWEFMLLPGEEPERLSDPAQLPALLRQIGDLRSPQIIRHSLYTFHALRASTFRRGAVFLVGDAAHLLPPFGGQGMNCGLRDAANLAWKVALVLRGLAHPTLLATYEQERAPHTVRMLRFSVFLGSVVMPTSRVRAALRDGLLRTFILLPPVASSFTEMRIKPSPTYGRGFLTRRNSRLGGQLLPQPRVRLADGRAVLLDELLGSGFALLRLCPGPETAFQPLRSDIWHKLRTRLVCILPSATHAEPACQQLWAIDDGQLTRFLRGRQDLFLLVRPDRYVYGAFAPHQEQSFVAALRQWLGSQDEQEIWWGVDSASPLTLS